MAQSAAGKRRLNRLASTASPGQGSYLRRCRLGRPDRGPRLSVATASASAPGGKARHSWTRAIDLIAVTGMSDPGGADSVRTSLVQSGRDRLTSGQPGARRTNTACVPRCVPPWLPLSAAIRRLSRRGEWYQLRVSYFAMVERVSADRYQASVPGFPDCVGQGDTPQRAVDRVQRACAARARVLRVAGRELPPYRTFLVTTVQVYQPVPRRTLVGPAARRSPLGRTAGA